MKLLFAFTAILSLIASSASQAASCDIHVPLKDEDLVQYPQPINGYTLVPHSHPDAPFNLLLTEVSKFEAKNIYTVTLTHFSGFKKEYHFTMSDQDWNGHVLKDLANLVIEKKMSEVTTVSEYEALKAKLDPKKNKVVPPQTELEFLLKQLPSCEKMFKKK